MKKERSEIERIVFIPSKKYLCKQYVFERLHNMESHGEIYFRLSHTAFPLKFYLVIMSSDIFNRIE